MTIYERLIKKEDVLTLRKQYLALTFHLAHGIDISHKKEPEYSFAEVKGFKNSPDTILRFREQDAFPFLASNFTDLLDITILHPNAALLTDNFPPGALFNTPNAFRLASTLRTLPLVASLYPRCFAKMSAGTAWRASFSIKEIAVVTAHSSGIMG